MWHIHFTPHFYWFHSPFGGVCVQWKKKTTYLHRYIYSHTLQSTVTSHHLHLISCGPGRVSIEYAFGWKYPDRDERLKYKRMEMATRWQAYKWNKFSCSLIRFHVLVMGLSTKWFRSMFGEGWHSTVIIRSKNSIQKAIGALNVSG